MSDGTAALVTIPLRDGGEVRVASGGVHIGDAFYTLASIQDARQVAPEPETIALRVAGAGLVEFQPARAGDGAVALEALFRLRPELRPAGFAPELPADLPPLPPPRLPPPPPPGYVPTGKPWLPNQPLAIPPEVASAYGPQPNRGRIELTPYPRSFGQLLGAIIRLYAKHIGVLLALSFVVALLPHLLINGLQLALDAQQGLDPRAGRDVLAEFLNASSATPSTPNIADPPLYPLLGSLLSMLELVLGAWTLAALVTASRDAVLGGRVSPRASIAGGSRRVWKTLGATLLVILILLGASLIALLLAVALAVLLSVVAMPFAGSQALGGSEPTPLGVALVACAMGIAFLPVFTLGVRLALSPSLAALGYEDPVRRSLLLTRRHWWRTFGVLLLANLPALVLGLGVLLLANLPALVLGLGVLAAEYASVGLAVVVVSPLVQLLVAPLSALASTALIYDLRLRREGYLVFMQEHLTPPPPKTT